MKMSALLGCATLLVVSTSIASPLAIVAHKERHLLVSGVPPGSKTLYDQNKDDAGRAILSQNVDGSEAADFFVVPGGHKWVIREVDVTGVYLNGSGPASSENVTFYKDHFALPGKPVVACPNEHGSGDGLGSFAIVFSPTCVVKLQGGNTYWVSVEANIDFGGGAGEWGWELSADETGNGAVWRSPGSDCPKWCYIFSDLMFALKGKDKL